MEFPQLVNFDFIENLGKGGTGRVDLAIDLRNGFPVAVKTLYKDRFKHEFIRKKFKQEANIYLYLEHSAIADLKDYIETDSNNYLVMEYIDGETVENIASTQLDEKKIKEYYEQILDAIAYAHHQKIFHLDIKPANIMLTAKNKIKIIDFGISSAKKDKLITQNLMGSPMYMSPEQASIGVIDHRSDIYSLGVMLFQFLTGVFPYRTTLSINEILEKIKTEKLQRLQETNPLINPKYQEIIDKATQKNPNKRYQSCEEFYYYLLNI